MSMIEIKIGQTGDDVVMNCYTVVVKTKDDEITRTVRNPIKYVQMVLEELLNE